jgi:hypothetical protein
LLSHGVLVCRRGGGEVSGRERRESYAKGAKRIPKKTMEAINIWFELGNELSSSKGKQKQNFGIHFFFFRVLRVTFASFAAGNSVFKPRPIKQPLSNRVLCV